MNRRIFAISGMHCAGCAAHLERAVGAIVPDGQVRVNFPAAQLFVEGGPSDEEILGAIRKAGFSGKITSGAIPGDGKETFFTLRRFAVAAFFALALMVTAHVPIANETVRGVLQALFAAGAMVAGWRFYPRGLLQLLRGAPDMDSLISLGTGGAFLYSVCALFTDGARFFDSVGMIVALILLGKGLEVSTRKKITGAITALLRELPEKAQKITPGGEVAVDPAEIRIGDRLKVRPGERIPADGVVVEGNCEVDESLLTGENLPVAKTPGGKVIGGSVNLAGSVVIEAVCVGDATVVARMVRMVSEAQSRRPAISRIADRVSGYFTWFVLGAAGCAALGWLISGAGAATALHYALAVLVVSCPCALGLATPLAVSAAISAAARRGILVRDGAALEKLGKIGKCVFDKTGTLTDGRFTIEKIVCRENFSENDLLRAAAAAERDIRHPLAETLRAESAKRQLEIPPFEMVSSGGSRGVACRIDGRLWKIGAPDFAGVELPGTTPETVVTFVCDGIFAGFIAFRDQLRYGAPELFDFLRRRGIATAILSGDRVSSVAAVGKMLGADEVFGALLPENKTGIIRAGRENAPGNLPVMMVGDGINDAPALALADVGVALGAGAAVALESADIVLPGNDLSGVRNAILLGEKTMKIIRENLFWAFFYNLLMIPLAAGVFAALFGGPQLSVVAAAAAMSCSSLGVVFNSRRLLRF